jgi:hypothetical protein
LRSSPHEINEPGRVAPDPADTAWLCLNERARENFSTKDGRQRMKLTPVRITLRCCR